MLDITILFRKLGYKNRTISYQHHAHQQDEQAQILWQASAWLVHHEKRDQVTSDGPFLGTRLQSEF